MRENMLGGVAHDRVDKQATTEVTGYSSAVSAAPGETIQLFVNVDHAQNVRWDLYRVGYYGGLGARMVAQGGPHPVSVQPECPIAADTGLIECDWASAFEVTIDPEWVSGYYFFELINDEGFGFRVPLIVREGKRRARALAQASVNTWQAYNPWGGINLYGNDRTDGVHEGRASRVSFDRPYETQNCLPPFLDLVRFLEQRGYDISYTTNVDIDADPSVLTGRKLFMTLAHDEYWTVAERDALEGARDQGVSLGFLSANTGYWRVRLEPSSRGIPRRIVTCYKSYGRDPVKNSPVTTDMFQNNPYPRPENALIGVAYKTWSKVPGVPYIVTNPAHWVYEGTGVKAFDALNTVVGSEWDGVLDNGVSPAGLEVLARATTLDDTGAFIKGDANISVYYPTPRSFVFAAGSITWGYGVGPGRYADPRIERMMENVLARAGVPSELPATQPGPAPPPSRPFEAKVLAGGTEGQNDGPALQASFAALTGVAAGPDGKLYMLDRLGSVIRVLSRDGVVSTLVHDDGMLFDVPIGMAFDSRGNLFVSDSRANRIVKVSIADGTIAPYAGSGTAGLEDASDLLSAKFSGPRAIAAGPNDELYVADCANNALRRIDPSGVTTVARGLYMVSGVAVGSDGAVYFSQIGNGLIGVLRNGQVTALAGGTPGNREGAALESRLQPGEGMLVDGDRLLFVDTENNRVRALSLKEPATISTVFGDGNAAPEPSDANHVWLPRSITRFDGGFAVSDFAQHRIVWFKEASP